MSTKKAQRALKSFYVQIIDPKGGMYSDGTFISINRRYYLNEQVDFVINRYGQDFLDAIIKAPAGEFQLGALIVIKE